MSTIDDKAADVALLAPLIPFTRAVATQPRADGRHPKAARPVTLQHSVLANPSYKSSVYCAAGGAGVIVGVRMEACQDDLWKYASCDPESPAKRPPPASWWLVVRCDGTGPLHRSNSDRDNTERSVHRLLLREHLAAAVADVNFQPPAPPEGADKEKDDSQPALVCVLLTVDVFVLFSETGLQAATMTAAMMAGAGALARLAPLVTLRHVPFVATAALVRPPSEGTDQDFVCLVDPTADERAVASDAGATVEVTYAVPFAAPPSGSAVPSRPLDPAAAVACGMRLSAAETIAPHRLKDIDRVLRAGVLQGGTTAWRCLT